MVVHLLLLIILNNINHDDKLVNSNSIIELILEEQSINYEKNLLFRISINHALFINALDRTINAKLQSVCHFESI